MLCTLNSACLLFVWYSMSSIFIICSISVHLCPALETCSFPQSSQPQGLLSSFLPTLCSESKPPSFPFCPLTNLSHGANWCLSLRAYPSSFSSSSENRLTFLSSFEASSRSSLPVLLSSLQGLQGLLGSSFCVWYPHS